MPWSFLVWVLCFFLQAALVGTAFYALIQLYDFEEDLINNFDCAKRCNRLAYPEIALQAVVLSLSLLGGHFFAALLNAGGLALLLRRLSIGKIHLDSLELWKLLLQAKRITYYKLAIFGASFAFTMFRTIEIVVHEVLSDHGRSMLKHVLSEALKDTIHF